MIYGTLVGIALFVVIVILCWMLSTKLERDKQRKKREEIVSLFSMDKNRSLGNSDGRSRICAVRPFKFLINQKILRRKMQKNQRDKTKNHTTMRNHCFESYYHISQSPQFLINSIESRQYKPFESYFQNFQNRKENLFP